MTLQSWIPTAPESHFPIQNIPFGIFSTAQDPRLRAATIVGDTVVDLSALYDAGLFNDVGLEKNVFASSSLNEFMEYPRQVWRNTRQRLIQLFEDSLEADRRLRENADLQSRALVSVQDTILHLPAKVTEYTDFYSSREHATNVGIMFRGVDNALQPNWLHLPVGYHGRASSVVASGTNVPRPAAQVQKDAANPALGSNFAACRLLDFELEIGAFLGGKANELGSPVTMAEAEDRIFGIVLLNDWSARDIQAWEYVPLGPFTAKNFATSISPWIVTLDALEDFRCESSAGPKQDNPLPHEYLQDPDYHRGTYNIQLEVALLPELDQPEDASTISISNFKYLYWNLKQQLVHHSVTGAVMRPGDLLGSGTISGPDAGSFGSLLELSWKGSKEIPLTKSKQANNVRKFLQDGDSVIMTGFASGKGYRVGFGTVTGKILPARSPYLKKN